jgi:hypothetical protein
MMQDARSILMFYSKKLNSKGCLRFLAKLSRYISNSMQLLKWPLAFHPKPE